VCCGAAQADRLREALRHGRASQLPLASRAHALHAAAVRDAAAYG
jgi:hypothetical protein